MSTDLDAALRDMLRTRAQDITTAPAPFVADDRRDGELVERRRRPSRPWLLAAAAAVVVLLVVAGAVALTRRSGHGTQTGATCEASMPAQWGSLIIPTGSTTLIAVMSDGSVLYERGREIVGMHPNGTRRAITTLSADTAGLPLGTADGTTSAMVGLGALSPIVVTWNAASGASHVYRLAAQFQGSADIGTFALLGGHLYVEGTRVVDGRTTIVDIDVTSTTVRVVHRDTKATLQTVAGYLVRWPGHTVRARLAPAVDRVLRGVEHRASLRYASSGLWAWRDRNGRVHWLSKDGRQAGPFDVPWGKDLVTGVSGPYVFANHAPKSLDVLDTTTGGYAQLPFVQAGVDPSRLSPYVTATNDGTVAVRPAQLPHLHC